jgi:hypothetical protein
MGPLVANFPQLTDKAALGMTEDFAEDLIPLLPQYP